MRQRYNRACFDQSHLFIWFDTFHFPPSSTSYRTLPALFCKMVRQLLKRRDDRSPAGYELRWLLSIFVQESVKSIFSSHLVILRDALSLILLSWRQMWLGGRDKKKKKNKSKKRERLLRGLHCKINALWWNAVRVKGCIIHAVGISVLEPVTKILNIQLGGREKGYFRYRRWMRFLQAAVEITLAAAGEACRQRLRSKVLSVLTLHLLPCSVYTLTNCRIIVWEPLVRRPTII